ncbi:hypothetical protein [Acidomonas methanolica]|uniref:hypothetical protein n=1 Tax=Acidomonas methanolica TaxID=437 RepID=UPI00211AA280|nr:hypothetical protein [Acidomonas methanolica]MCQ9156000.1 hypothetical protein [Acidomonas methanolica]
MDGEHQEPREADAGAVARLEQAMNRIAWALDRREVPSPETDLQTVAANIDALRARIRAALEIG